MAQAVKHLPPPMTSERGPIPQALEQIVHRCLAHDRGQRYASVTELRAALGQLDRQLALGSEARMRAATTVRRAPTIPVPAPVAVVVPSNRVQTFALAALGPASALVTMVLVRVVLAVLH